MSETPKFISIESLPEPEQETAAELERKTDEIYGLRTQLALFYRDYRQYLPRGKRIEDVHKAILEGQELEDLVASNKIDAAIAEEAKTPEERAFLFELRRDDIVAAMELATQTYGELMAKGGAFKGTLSDEQKDLKAYYQMRWGELGRVGREIHEIRAQAAFLEEKINHLRNNPRLFKRSAELIRKYKGDHNGLLATEQKLTEESPEAYLFVRGGELQDTKTVFDKHGTIVETPYVKVRLAHMEDLAARGRPIFIHGELGSGKTELAKHFARKRGAEALIIPGYRGIEAEQLIAARAIERKPPPPPAEQLRIISAGWQENRARMLADARERGLVHDDLTAFEQKLDSSDRELYEKAYLEAFRSPVETRIVLAPVLAAMKEGRVVIIDEMNAIPHHALIILNDYLLKRPGDVVTSPFPGAEPFTVKEGFIVVATGNYKPEDGKMYVGRQPIDAAFLSRWGIVSYDFLPMSRVGEAPGMAPEALREKRKEDELFQMIVTRLLDRDLSARLPAGSLEKLRRLTVVARNLQDIFSGVQAADAYYAEVGAAKVKPQDVLKENVLSIRHLLPILDQWQADGFTRELDDYLFLEYIARSDARPEEKLYLYRILRVQGDLFAEAKGWPSIADREKILRYPIDQKIYGQKEAVIGLEIKTYSPQEVIETLFGPAPERQVVTREFADRGKRKKEELPPEDELARRRLWGRIEGQFSSLQGEDFVKK